MADMDPQQVVAQISAMLAPWQRSIENPLASQEEVLQRLLAIYAATRYGSARGAAEVGSFDEYRRAFPAVTYDDMEPLLKRVMAGENDLLLTEPVAGWAITRGTTKGTHKYIPMTPTDISMRVSAGRAVMNFVLQEKRFDILAGVNLNLNFPSVVGSVSAGGRDVEYGYSSGIYTRFVHHRTPIRSMPAQEEIDELGGGKTKRDWEARFELALERCKGQNVTILGGVAPTALRFGKHLRAEHGFYPKQEWDIQIMTLGSVAGINTRLAPALHALYGPGAIREIYGATEGMFGQQRDAKRAWVPNYDLYFLEVETRAGVKMLQEMSKGELGSLVVSTPVLPRYRIGDQILAVDPPYFRCIGREQWYTPLAYAWGEMRTMNLGRL
jgi:hypothetical protein